MTQVFIVEYDADALGVGYKVIQAETVNEAYDKMLDWIRQAQTSRYIKLKIIGDGHKPFTVRE